MKIHSAFPMIFPRAAGLSVLWLAVLGACSSSPPAPPATMTAPTPTCASPGGPEAADGADADMHCVGQPAQPVSLMACSVLPDGGGDDGGDTDFDAGPPLPCGEDSAAYGSTMYGTEGDDDDCKYHVQYSVGGICEDENVYFMVTATSKVDGTPVTGAATYAELCLNNTHIGPPGIDSAYPHGLQMVEESSPGTYKVGPVQFDAAGKWTVRFHFFEICTDTLADSQHGHAAFFVDVP